MGLVSFDITCPHCLKERAVIEAFAEKQIEKTPFFNVAFVCRSCHRGGVAIVEIPSDHYHVRCTGNSGHYHLFFF
ncbi:hypothetical protein DXB10_25185 [Escherichia coli]|nr:hypothetical protein DXB20_25520 [Escherichia coli]RGO39807.1 hypothetical protein DXB13_25525 [Escherichia coli]RGO58872.1 hypothetical protein DXB10_25185 [Escherichia coli]